MHDHLVLLAAFDDFARRSGPRFHRVADSAAFDYERWAQTVLPARSRRWSDANSHSHCHTHAHAHTAAHSHTHTHTAAQPGRAGTWPHASSNPSSVPCPPPSSLDGKPVTTAVLTASPVASPLSLSPTGSPPESPLLSEGAPHHTYPLSASARTRSFGSAGSAAASIVSSVASSGSLSVSRSPAPAPLTAAELPPLAVLMCWHAHLMNPGQFALDTDGTYASLHGLAFPLAEAAAAVRAGTLPDDLAFVYSSDNLRAIPSISGWTPPDISAAVQRAARIVAAIRSHGWLAPELVDGDAAPFQRAIVRYHAWLDLMAAVDGHPFLAPTHDIQLVWHTHQLRGTRYRVETERLRGAPLDRADHFVVVADTDGLKRTAGLWRARFKHEYIESPRKGGGSSGGGGGTLPMPVRRGAV